MLAICITALKKVATPILTKIPLRQLQILKEPSKTNQASLRPQNNRPGAL